MIDIPLSLDEAGSLHRNVAQVPRSPVTVRIATASDLPFIDSLQKQHAKQVGRMPTKQLEGNIERGHVLVAEEVGSRQYAVGSENGAGVSSLPTAWRARRSNHRRSQRADCGLR